MKTKAEKIDILYKVLSQAPRTNSKGKEYDTCDLIVMNNDKAWKLFADIEDDDSMDWSSPVVMFVHDGDYHIRVCLNAMGGNMKELSKLTTIALKRKHPNIKVKCANMTVKGKVVSLNGFEKCTWPEKEHLRREA